MCTPGDDDELVAQIREGYALLEEARAAPASVRLGLALDYRWPERGALGLLRRRIRQVGVPVGIAFASTHDPLGSRDAVQALQQLLHEGDVAIFRTDLAGVGAVVHGAPLAGVGLSSSLRHLAIPRRRKGGATPGRPPAAAQSLHVLVPGCLAWVSGLRLWYAGHDHPDLVCHCDAHPEGRWLREYRDTSYRDEAALHAFYTWRQVVDRLAATSSYGWRFEWGRICREAVERVERLESDTGISFAKKPLRHWTSL